MGVDVVGPGAGTAGGANLALRTLNGSRPAAIRHRTHERMLRH